MNKDKIIYELKCFKDRLMSRFVDENENPVSDVDAIEVEDLRFDFEDLADLIACTTTYLEGDYDNQIYWVLDVGYIVTDENKTQTLQMIYDYIINFENELLRGDLAIYEYLRQGNRCRVGGKTLAEGTYLVSPTFNNGGVLFISPVRNSSSTIALKIDKAIEVYFQNGDVVWIADDVVFKFEYLDEM